MPDARPKLQVGDRVRAPATPFHGRLLFGSITIAAGSEGRIGMQLKAHLVVYFDGIEHRGKPVGVLCEPSELETI